MTMEVFLRDRAELIIDDITDHYGIQRGKDGERFIYEPMPDLSYFIDVFEFDIESGLDMYDEDVFDDEDCPFPEHVYQECIDEITTIYYEVSRLRKRFIYFISEIK